MNDITPPFDSSLATPPPPPASIPPPPTPPSKKVCTGLGVLLFVVTSGLSFLVPPVCLLGLAIAIGSLFVAGYRCVGAGYFLGLGLLLLGIVIYCSNHPFEDR